ncbi:hypothetical protein GCM10023088_23780 [Actinomadura verrucosospora]
MGCQRGGCGGRHSASREVAPRPGGVGRVWAETLHGAVCTDPWGQVRSPEGKAVLANELGNGDFGPLPGGGDRTGKPDPDPVTDTRKLVVGETDSTTAPRRPMTRCYQAMTKCHIFPAKRSVASIRWCRIPGSL